MTLARAIVKSYNQQGETAIYLKKQPPKTCSRILARSDVIHRDYTSDIALAYREADFFAFPSLEEGGPLVTYEAMANGLPVLTSPMRAGGVV